MKGFFVFLLATAFITGILADMNPLWDSPRDQNASVIPQSRIIQGTPATLGQFRYFAHLEFSSLLGKVGNCGGAIAHINWVLTAASCASQNLLGIAIKHLEIRVRAGTLTASGSAEQTKIVSYANIQMHPDYKPNTLMNDIALLKTDSTFVVTDNVRPGTFVDFSTDPASYVGRFVTVSGFGYTTNAGPVSNVLLYTKDLKVIPFADCQAQYSPRIIPTTSFCTQDTVSPISATCHGDSGGAVTMKFTDAEEWIIGIISYVSADGCNVDPQGHTNVQEFLVWILRTIFS